MPFKDLSLQGSVKVERGGTGYQVEKTVASGVSVAATNANDRFTATVSPTFDQVLVVGDKVAVKGSSNNDGIYVVTEVAAGYFAVGAGGTLTDETAVFSITRLRRP